MISPGLYSRVFDEPDNTYAMRAAKIGYACRLHGVSESGRYDPVMSVVSRVEAAIDHQQIRFFFGPRGNPVAYVSWAHLAIDVESRITNARRINLHPSEWNEGESTWIVDLVSPYGHFGSMIESLLCKEFLNVARVRYMRNTVRSNWMCKELSRDSLEYISRRFRSSRERAGSQLT